MSKDFTRKFDKTQIVSLPLTGIKIFYVIQWRVQEFLSGGQLPNCPPSGYATDVIALVCDRFLQSRIFLLKNHLLNQR